MRVTLISILLLLQITGFSQVLAKKVINTAGGSYRSGNIGLNVSVGEPIVGNIGTSISLSQGFFTGYRTIAVVVPETLSLLIYPNPSRDAIFIRGDIGNIKLIQIIDAGGKVLSTQLISTRSIDIRALPAGFYLARLLGRSNEVISVFKFIKVQ